MAQRRQTKPRENNPIQNPYTNYHKIAASVNLARLHRPVRKQQLLPHAVCIEGMSTIYGLHFCHAACE